MMAFCQLIRGGANAPDTSMDCISSRLQSFRGFEWTSFLLQNDAGIWKGNILHLR